MAELQTDIRPRTVAQLICGMALFGTATPLSKIIGEAFPVFAASFARMAIASAVLAPVVWLVTDRFANARRSDIGVMAAIAMVGMVGFTAAMLFGVIVGTFSSIYIAGPLLIAFRLRVAIRFCDAPKRSQS